jgi:hypothetical protein
MPLPASPTVVTPRLPAASLDAARIAPPSQPSSSLTPVGDITDKTMVILEIDMNYC